MNAPAFSERIRAVVRGFARLLADRAREAEALARDFDEQCAGARHAEAHARAAAEAACADALARVRHEHQHRLADVRARAEHALEQTRQRMESRLSAWMRRTQQLAQAARERLAEAQWLIEAQAESGQARVRQRDEANRRRLHAAARTLDTVACHAALLLPRAFGTGTPARASAFTLPDTLPELLTRYEETARDAHVALRRLARRLRPPLIRAWLIPIWAAASALVAGGLSMLLRSDAGESLIRDAALAAAAAFILLLGLRGGLRWHARRPARELTRLLAWAEQLRPAVQAAADRDRDQNRAALQARLQAEAATARRAFDAVRARIHRRNTVLLTRLRDAHARRLAQVRRSWSDQIRSLDEAFRTQEEALMRTREADLAQARQRLDDQLRGIRQQHEDAWRRLADQWHASIHALHAEREALTTLAHQRWPLWSDPCWLAFEPSAARGPVELVPAARFGRLEIDLGAMEGGLPDDARLACPDPVRFDLPAILDLRDRGALLVRAGPDGRDAAIALLRNVMLRLLTSLPPGKIRFTIFDPVGLGESFAAFMHLADDDPALVSDRIWTEPRHLEQKLGDLTAHMETVIQKYLRNEHEAIHDYNAQAGELAEPFRVLVIADFPAQISEPAARRLASIIASGPRCGVYALIAADTRRPPAHIPLSLIERHSEVLLWRDGRFIWRDPDLERWPLEFEWPPAEDALTALLQRVASHSRSASRVRVAFESVAPARHQTWSLGTEDSVRVPLGRAGTRRIQHLTLGTGTAQHALIAGRTGAGKSTLLHVLITSAALWYPPDELEFYLVDFKKGVEFRDYAACALPHARVVAIESEREFGVSVLRRLDAELARRGTLFRGAGVQDLTQYRRRSTPDSPSAPLPRILLIVDEFQEFFVEDDRLAQEAALLLDRLVRQGRAFGIHVVLGSQTLGGAYSIARSTIGQMAVRIALQCSEADAYLIMDEDNPAPRRLSRPGEAIYNDASGLVEGNSPFQVAWLDEDERRNRLHQLAVLASTLPPDRRPSPPIVFEGNLPADLRRCDVVMRALRGSPDAAPTGTPTLWLGEPVSIRETVALALHRRHGAHLLIVGSQPEPALATLAAALLSVAATRPADRLIAGDGSSTPVPTIILIDAADPIAVPGGTLARWAGRLPGVWATANPADAEHLLARVAREVERRLHETASSPPLVLFIAAVHRLRQLRPVDDLAFVSEEPPQTSRDLARILAEGPGVDVHVVAWCDTAGSVDRTLGRAALRHFDARVLFQMSAADSTLLADSPVASALGRHRALLVQGESAGLEKFRPFALPDEEWWLAAARMLQARQTLNAACLPQSQRTP